MTDTVLRHFFAALPGVEVLCGPEIVPWQGLTPLTLPVQPGIKTYGLNLVNQQFLNPLAQEVQEFVFCQKRDGGTVLTILTDGRVVLVEQFKQAVDEVVFEFPAFMLKEGETVREQAVLEIGQEAGIKAAKLERLGQPIFLAARKFQTREHLLVATGCEFVHQPANDQGEVIRAYAVTQDTLWYLIASGVIRTAGTVAAALQGLMFGYLDLRVFGAVAGQGGFLAWQREVSAGAVA